MIPIEIYTMNDYCIKIKSYLNVYNNNSIVKKINGDFELELQIAQEDLHIGEDEFFLTIQEVVGKISRVLGAPYLNWVGGKNESFTKNYFIDTFKSV